MFERTSYPAGVPCWVETMQPDPEAAAAFYSEVFGWNCENRMPDDAGGQYWIAELHNLDVAAIGGPSAPDTPVVWNTYTAVTSVDETTKKVQAAGGTVLTEPVDAMDAGRYATFADPEGANVLGLAGRSDDRRAARQRARHVELQRVEHARPRNRRRLLRRGVRMGHGVLLDGRFRIRDLQAARLRRVPRAEQPRPPGERRSGRRTRRLHRRGAR